MCANHNNLMARINIFMNKGLIERQSDVTGIETDIIECTINN